MAKQKQILVRHRRPACFANRMANIQPLKPTRRRRRRRSSLSTGQVDDGVSCKPSVPDICFEQKAAGAVSASRGSPGRLDGGSLAPPSERLKQSEPDTSGPDDQIPFQRRPIAHDNERNAPPPPPINRKPILPPIVDRELYDRLTRSARGSDAENSVPDISPNQQSGRRPKR